MNVDAITVGIGQIFFTDKTRENKNLDNGLDLASFSKIFSFIYKLI